MKKYISLSLIYIFTILGVFYISSLYKRSMNIIGDSNFKHLGINKISKSTYDDLYTNISNFATENNTFILYLTYSNNNFLSFERELKKFIIDSNLDNSFVYLDIDSLENLNSINKLINDLSEFDLKLNKSDMPIFIYFKDSNILDVISNHDLNIEQVKNKFIELDVIE